MSHLDEGLVEKFTITRNDSGEEVGGAFVLLPETDPLAAAALLFYSDLVHLESGGKSPLTSEVDDWLLAIDVDGQSMYDRAAHKYNQIIDGTCPDGCL